MIYYKDFAQTCQHIENYFKNQKNLKFTIDNEEENAIIIPIKLIGLI